jgi:hypothetical protein
MSNTETIRMSAAIAEMQEHLLIALDRIDTLERELAERDRLLAELRLARAVDRAPRPRRPKIRKPLRPRTDDEWAAVLSGAGL